MSINVNQLIVSAIAFFLFVSGVPIDDKSEEETTLVSSVEDEAILNVEDAKTFLQIINEKLDKWANKLVNIEWNYASNLTDTNLAKKLEFSTKTAYLSRSIFQEVNEYPWESLKDDNLYRQFSHLNSLGTAALSDEKYAELEEITTKMENIYSTAKICYYKEKDKCDLAVEELTDIMGESRDPEELKYIWIEWRKVSGEKVKDLYPKYIELSNLVAELNNLTDYSQYWLGAYEVDDIIDLTESLWQEIKPLYQQIHAYARRQLRNQYGDSFVSEDGLIPAHLLGEIWGQSWSSIAKFTAPYPGKEIPDVTNAMIEQEYDVEKIFRLAESCFVSMNMSAMPELFWKNSIFKKPDDRKMICHASAWDFYDGKDYRIKQCSSINMESLMTAHHEMGHIQYFMEYKNQPNIFKDGANPGFHEAVGDVIALSVSTPGHLKKIGLLKSNETDSETDLNFLYFNSLEKVVMLPFAYSIDQWRWGVFKKNIISKHYNCEWWKIREKLGGIEPPIDRSEEDFDPGSKYHVVADVEYLRYFFSYIIQFQFYKALCIEAEQYDPDNPNTKPLHLCDITSSTKAGNLLKSMMQMGSSKHWKDAMQKLTGQREMSATGLLEYFKPLYDWLKIENENNDEYIGWINSNKHCVQTRAELKY